MQHQPYASSAVGSSDALLRATAGSSGLSRRAVLRFGALFSAGLALSACSGQSLLVRLLVLRRVRVRRLLMRVVCFVLRRVRRRWVWIRRCFLWRVRIR